jgi:hypothetical protein
MFRWLSNIGRFFVVLTAVVMVPGATVYGTVLGGLAHGSNGAVIGGLVGFLVAGAVFGTLATLYDICDSLRALAFYAWQREVR